MKIIRMHLAVMAMSLLPSVAVAGIILAQAPGTPLGTPFEVADRLADKNMSYWFICLAVVAIGSWSFIAKWLINQLEGQRKTNAELVDRLVNYMSADHARTIVVAETVTTTLARLVEKLDGKGH